MKLLTVTIKNYRVHKDLTVAFDAARTVIGGPNEAGKSTLVEAIHHAFFLRCRTTGAAHKAMLSEFHSGHPTVELTFESGSRRYTITKVFSGNQSASTTLREHPATREAYVAWGADGGAGRTLRDDEAEARIHEILRTQEVSAGRSLDSRLKMQWAHLWVWQGSATEDPLAHANSERHAELLRERLSRADGGGVLESPLDAAAARDVAARHAASFTDKCKVRAGSDLDKSRNAVEAAEAGRAQAAANVETLNEAVDAIDAANRTSAMCEINLGEAQQELDGVKERQKQAAELAVQIAEEQAAAAAAGAAYAEASRVDAEITACRTAIAALESKMDPGLRALAHLEQLEQEGTVRCDAANGAVALAGQRQAAAATAFALHDACEKHERLLTEREGLGGRCALIAAQRTKASELRAERDQLPSIVDADVTLLVRRDRARELADATLDAIATKVELVSGEVPMTLAGAALAPGMPVTITGDAELAVGLPGGRAGSAVDKGAIARITPGGGRSLAEATQRRDEARAALEADLAVRGVASVDEAREIAARRQTLNADIHAVNLAIAGLGGDQAEADLAELDAGIAKAAAEVRRRSPEGHVRPASLAAAQAALAAVERELAAAGEAVATANAEATAARKHLEGVVAERLQAAENLRVNRTDLESLRMKIAVLEERHGTDRTERIAAFKRASGVAAAQLAASRARLAKLAPDALDLDRQRLERTIANLLAAKQDAETRRQLARATLQLQGTIDPRDDLARAAVRQRLAAAEHARAYREAEAVKLLATLFGEKKREVESQFVTPLTSRVSGYLERLYGEGTTVGVDYENGRFNRLTLSRRGVGDATFEFSQLSSGAREQVGAAFRLAMAEVLAEDHDGCLPIVFDDAFVNSDADRQRALQRLLDLAAIRGLQVIVLACRPESYATLGGVEVTLSGNPFAAGDEEELN